MLSQLQLKQKVGEASPLPASCSGNIERQMFDGFIPSDEAKHNGLWLSLVERSVRDREVAGSNPVNPTIYFLIKDAYKTYERSIYLRLPKNISILIRASN